MPGKTLGPRPRERDLPHSGGGLRLFKLQRAFSELQHGAPHGDRAGGDDEDISASLVQARDVVHQSFQPSLFQAARLLDQQRGADLDDDTAEFLEIWQGVALGLTAAIPSRAPWRFSLSAAPR